MFNSFGRCAILKAAQVSWDDVVKGTLRHLISSPVYHSALNEVRMIRESSGLTFLDQLSCNVYDGEEAIWLGHGWDQASILECGNSAKTQEAFVISLTISRFSTPSVHIVYYMRAVKEIVLKDWLCKQGDWHLLWRSLQAERHPF